MRDFTEILERHGLRITGEELECWQSILQAYEENLTIIRSIRIDKDEPATVFYAAWDAEV